MATKRLTAKDYKKEYEDLTVGLSVLEKRIELRFLTLCKRYPDVVLYTIPDISQKTLNMPVYAKDFDSRNNRPVARLNTDARLKFIAIIEQELANRHPHKQTEIVFPDKDCISPKSPDGKCHFVDDSKYCYHCGLNKNYF